nr:immunoglobulin light chain junction region [Macaca mulatta]MOW71537.1 immunoglobulin light chain junction region [Macaca mulatta]
DYYCQVYDSTAVFF